MAPYGVDGTIYLLIGKLTGKFIQACIDLLLVYLHGE